MAVLFGFVYILFPFLSTPIAITLLYLDRKRYRFYLFAIILNLGVVGYYYEPHMDHDLFRHFEYIDSLRFLGFNHVISLFSQDPLIVKNILFYLISLTGNNSLLPLVTVMITYYIVLDDLFDYGNKEKLSSGILIGLMIVFLSWFYLLHVMGGIRFSLSIAVFFHGMYREFVMHKRNINTFLFYAIPCFFHFAVIILLLARFSLPFFKNFKLLYCVVLVSWSFFIDFIIKALSSLNILYFQQLVIKINGYQEYNLDALFHTTNNLIKIGFCIINLVCIVYLSQRKKDIYKNYKDMYFVICIVSLFCIGGSRFFIIPNRYGLVALTMMPIVLMPVMKHCLLLKYFRSLSIILFIIIGFYFQYRYSENIIFGIGFFEFFTKNLIDLLNK